MSKDLEVKIGSTVYSKIVTARMSEHERSRALHAMQTANDLIAAFSWVAGKLEQFAARTFFRPSLKH